MKYSSLAGAATVALCLSAPAFADVTVTGNVALDKTIDVTETIDIKTDVDLDVNVELDAEKFANQLRLRTRAISTTKPVPIVRKKRMISSILPVVTRGSFLSTSLRAT